MADYPSGRIVTLKMAVVETDQDSDANIREWVNTVFSDDYWWPLEIIAIEPMPDEEEVSD